MAVLVFTNASVMIGSSDLSNHTKSVTVEYNAELLSATAMGVGSTRSRVAGFKDWTITCEFLQDFAGSMTDSILFPLVGTAVTIAVKPVNTSVGVTNPSYNGTAYLENYQPFGGGVGDVATTTCNFRAAGVLNRTVA